jgi:hypothetical protein
VRRLSIFTRRLAAAYQKEMRMKEMTNASVVAPPQQSHLQSTGQQVHAHPQTTLELEFEQRLEDCRQRTRKRSALRQGLIHALSVFALALLETANRLVADAVAVARTGASHGSGDTQPNSTAHLQLTEPCGFCTVF